ncbi:hypothetical protein WR25_16497 [Diploscapter pachys]|uniref:Uncharacterized protein n=1 Tax=Diploscapter pachys TaxID=2018661 RepID=A0A2A2JWX3_9BILA|nr:hypothetical protein WR25_16497 [Diploscapter pachys]
MPVVVHPDRAAGQPAFEHRCAFGCSRVGTGAAVNLVRSPTRVSWRAAAIYTIIQTCKANGGDPHDYPIRRRQPADRAAAIAEFDDAVAFGVLDAIAEHRRAGGPSGCIGKQIGKVRAEEDVVAQHQRDAVVADEVRADRERLGKAVGARLLGVGHGDPERRSVAEQAAVIVKIFGAGDDQHVADSRQHQHRQRDVAERLTPVARGDAIGGVDSGVAEPRIGGPPGRRRIIAARDARDFGRWAAARARLAEDFDREIGPTDVASVAEVEGAGRRVRIVGEAERDRHQRLREIGRAGRTAALVVDHGQPVAALGDAQHCLDEIAAVRAHHPGGADDGMACAAGADREFAAQFGRAASPNAAGAMALTAQAVTRSLSALSTAV